MAQQTVMYFAGLLISPLVNGLGVAAAASYSVVMRVYNLNATVYQNSSRSVSNYTAQCVGQDKINKINKGVFAGLLQGVAFVLPFILTCCIFYKPICSLFFKADADVLTKEYAYLFARKYLPFVVLNLACNLFHGLFRGAKATGHLFVTTFTGAFSQYVLSVLLVARNGMNGFFLAWVLSWAIEAVLCFTLYFIGRWKPKQAE
jgi:Na+-driven multidrug efflux pump